MRLPAELSERAKTIMCVEGAQIRWRNEETPKPEHLIAGAVWVTGARFFYVDEEGMARSVLGKVVST